NGAKVVIIKDVYTIDGDQVYCSIYKKMFARFNECNSSLTAMQNKYKDTDDVFNYLENKYKDSVIFIDPKKVLSNESKYYTSIDNVVIYRDAGHISYDGSKYVGKTYLEQYGNPFKQFDK
ncbi:MAG TPA: hypothetical protein DCL21_07080, partial [Alphaproteobacteria bacterium]|nr:hypothetical protein [Alphaproteobacteria bacterium]